MAKEKEAIGLDVGARAIKLVRLRRTGPPKNRGRDSSAEILDYKIVEYKSPDEERAVVYREAASFVNKGGKNRVPVIASIEGHQVFTRVFKLPAVGKGKLARIIGYEAQQQVPFPITEVVWTYQCLRRVSPEESDVVLVAVKKDAVEEFLSSFRQAGLSIDDVLAPAVGLSHLLGPQLQGQAEATLVLDLGARTTNIIILEKENLWFRMVPLGGEVITQAISQEFNLGLTEAEKFKIEKGRIILDTSYRGDPTDKKISTCIIRALTRLTGEISRSIEVYCSSFNSLGIKCIFCTGGTSRLADIGQFLAKKFRADVEGLDVAKGFNIAPSVDKERFLRDAPRLGVALGLALGGVERGRLQLSLLPREIVRRQQWSKRQAYMAVSALLLVFLGFSFSGYNIQLANMYKANIQKLKSEKRALGFNKKELVRIRRHLDAVREKMDVISEVVSARALWIDMLLALEELIPRDVWLTGIRPEKLPRGGSFSIAGDLQKPEPEYTYTADYIELRVSGKTTGTYQEVVALRDAIDKSGYFVAGATEVVSANPPLDGVRDFVIKARLKPQSH